MDRNIGMQLIRESLPFRNENPNEVQNCIIIQGVTGDLSKKKVMPTLWELYREELLPPNTKIIGFGRSPKTVDDIRKLVSEYVGLKNEEEKAKYDEFWKQNYYVKGNSDKDEGYDEISKLFLKLESGKKVANRLFYFALPPFVYAGTATAIHNTSMSKTGWTRLVIEKPFGKDSESSQQLSDHLSKIFKEDQIYRIDHYLGKEMVQNIMSLRFANQLYEPAWNNHYISNVEILFKEPFGIQGRGSYFDEYAMIRDVMQNHLLQVLCLIAMEKPKSTNAEDIRNEKVKVLKAMEALKMEDVVVGQYVGNPDGEGEAKIGYLDDPSVKNKKSIACTYALTVHKINNSRWSGVPFFISAGKGLNESRVEVRIQFKDVPNNIFGGDESRNMLIIRVQPNEAINQKIMIKKPGMGFSMEETELDLTYSTRYKNVVLPDAYERLILEVFASSQINYVRSDELKEAWRVFTPILHQIEKDNKPPNKYMFGSRGVKEAEQLMAKHGLKNDD